MTRAPSDEESEETAPLRDAVDEALALIAAHGPVPAAEDRSLALPSLLDQARAVAIAARERPEDPIRLLHQFACTGGTIINRCLALLPNVRLLSEIEPLSRILISPQKPLFSPSDLVHQMQYGPRPITDGRLVSVFRAGLSELRIQCLREGERLVLRDHAHSQYCTGNAVSTRPSLRRIVDGIAPIRGALTVRHPIDSWLSLRKVGWVMFRPATFGEYIRRYHAFLDDHDDLPILRYESFVEDPEASLKMLADALDLSYREGMPDLVEAVRMSGDSGRSASTIARRARHAIPPDLAREVRGNADLDRLCDRLGY